MMTDCHATAFIKARYQGRGEDCETVTVRLEAKNALMLQCLSGEYKFPISTSFTDITSMHLVDILASLNRDDFDEIVTPFEQNSHAADSALARLQDEKILPETQLYSITRETL